MNDALVMILTRALRKMPLGRRLMLTMAIYALAVLVIVVSGWRLVTLVEDYRSTTEVLDLRMREITAVRDTSSRFLTVITAYADTRDPAIGDDVAFKYGQIGRAAEAVSLKEDDIEAVLGGLETVLKDSMGNFEDLRALNQRAGQTYHHLGRLAGEVSGLMAFAQSRMAQAGGSPDPLIARFDQVTALIDEFHIFQRRATGKEAESTLAAFRDALESASRSRPTEAERLALSLADDRLGQISHELTTLLRLSDSWVGQSRFLVFVNLEKVTAAIDALDTLGKVREHQLRADLQDKTRATLIFVGSLAGVVLVLGFLANALVIQSIRRPILALNEVMQNLAGGTLDRAVEGQEAADEIGAMARTLEIFKLNTRRMNELEVEKREILRRENEEIAQSLAQLDEAHREISALNTRLNSENLRLGAELDVSRRIQQMLLPRDEELSEITALDIAAFMESADEVGGDYYDIMKHEGGVRIGIGDVTGHGLESGVVMLLTQSAVRTLTTDGRGDRASLVDVLNRSLAGNMRRMGSGKNLTFALIDYQPRPEGGGAMRVIGQHESLIVIRTDGRVEELDTLMLGMPLGLVDDMRTYLDEAALSLEPGDMVVLYTDGITEAADTGDRLYGMDRLKATCLAHRTETSGAIKDAVIADVRAHIGERAVLDDLTLIVIKQR
ncbi:PP2C family protein-serine/threonine phosphatase [Rhodospirillum rubrum]|nr:SpoIIE family protein phosphatase [Rhodospirillum rubrum]